MSENGLKIVEMVVKAADDKKAQDIMVLNMQGISILADYFVVMHGNSDRQVGAIVDGIVGAAEENGVEIRKVEGQKGGDWLLIDLIDVVVHVFQHETRSFYNLEKLWADAELVNIADWVTE